MSIWVSWNHIGTDPNDWQDMDGTPVPKVAERGVVLSYANGWSNHYPDETGEAERPAALLVASIPVWCVPDHDEEDDLEPGPWLRLEVAAPETLNFWVKDPTGGPTVDSERATVVLDEAAVRALRDDLDEWLARPKAHPRETKHVESTEASK